MQKYKSNKENSDLPVVIVGAGPGGSVAALSLAQKGVRSIVIDKAVFPRQKPCGDVVTSQTLRVLERIGLDPTNELPLISGQATWGTTCIAPNGSAVDVNFKPLHHGSQVPSCYTLERASFDNYLVNKLKNNPLIELREGTSVTNLEKFGAEWYLHLEDNNEPIRSEMLVVASGCNSSISKKIQAIGGQPNQQSEDQRHFGVGLRGYFQDLGGWRKPDMPEFHVLKALLPGGLYLTPLANGLVNVNMVMRLDFVAKNNINLNERFWDVISSHPILKKRFSTQNLVGKLQGSSLSFGTIKRPVSGNGYVLVGDAAGLIDLLSANGICNAVASAEIAAEVIADPLTNYAAPQRYDAVLNAKLQNELMLGRLVSPFLGNPKYFGVIESVLNFIASRAQGGTALSQLLYHPNIGQLLRSPSFYKQMVWG